MTKPYLFSLLIGVPVLIGILFWKFGNFLEHESRDISKLKTMPLPSSVSAYTKISYLLIWAGLSGFIGTKSTFLTISGVPSRYPEFIYLFAIIAFIFDVSFVYYMYRIIVDTSVSPFGKPLIQISKDGITYKHRWSLQWTEIEEINVVSQNAYKRNVRFMILNVKDIQRIPKNRQSNSTALGYNKIDDIKEPFLAIELASTTLPIWEYQILIDRYLCASRGVQYVPTKYEWPYQSIDFKAEKINPKVNE